MPRLSLSSLAIACDLDGTIVLDERLSPATVSVLKMLGRLGIPVVIATARTPAGLWPLSEVTSSLTIAVCCNGAIGTSFAVGGEFLWAEQMSDDSVAFLREDAKRSLPAAGFGAYDGSRWYLDSSYVDVRGRTPSGRYEIVDDPLSRGPYYAAQLVHPTVPAAAIAAKLNSMDPAQTLFEVSFGQSAIVDLGPAGVDKGAGLRRALNVIGKDPSDAISFGDAENDLPVFASVGRSVAMGNASHDVKAAADDITLDASEDGFAAYVRDQILPALHQSRT